MMTRLLLLLASLGYLTRCDAVSRINLGASTVSFASFYLNGYLDGDTYIHSIQEDEWIPGNILATVGNALYTINANGGTSLLAGSLQTNGFRDGDGSEARFNKTSGMVQLDDGKTVIISDYWNFCLRKVDRVTNEVTTFAGQCNVYSGIGSHGRIGLARRDGPVDGASFVNPVRMRYIKSTNEIYVLDIANHQTYIRSIDLTTSYVRTVFSNRTFNARDFLIDDGLSTFTFASSPGILQLDSSSGKGTWLAGCGNLKVRGKCSDNYKIRQISTKLSHGMIRTEGVYVVTDELGNEVYIVDPQNNDVTTLCPPGSPSYCSIRGPSGMELIGEYLYIGEAINPNSHANVITIKRIKLSIASQTAYIASSGQWLDREEAPYTYEPTTVDWLNLPNFIDRTTYNPFGIYKYQSSTPGYYVSPPGTYHNVGALVGGLAGGALAIILCCICVGKAVSNKGAEPLRTNTGRPAYRLGANNGTAGYRRRRWWILFFTFRKRESDADCPPAYERLNEEGAGVSTLSPPPYEEGETKYAPVSGSLAPSP